MNRPHLGIATIGCVAGFLVFAFDARSAETGLAQEVQELKRQNKLLQEQLQKQQTQIDRLTEKVSEAKPQVPKVPDEEENQTSKSDGRGFSFGKVHLSGEGGVAFFHTGEKGPYPNSEFRVDEAKLFVEAPIWKDVYFFTELNITLREDPSIYVQVGELYLDFENLSRFWNRDGQLNLRVGRFDIPFGEEYLTRDAINNPLVSHSLSDTWGIDEGIEIYGSIAKVQYTLAVQNGGHPSLRDYDADKSITLRIGYDPVPQLHVSVSAMRTGALATTGDQFSELWFGNAFVRSLDFGATRFQANLLEADAQFRWSKGYLRGAGGYLKYNDNGSSDTQREVYYYYVEGLQHLTSRLYAAARWSQMIPHHGYPIAGDGSWGEYFFGGFTRIISRLTAGAGYRLNHNLLLKAEYTFNTGREVNGAIRNHENIVAAEAAFSF